MQPNLRVVSATRPIDVEAWDSINERLFKKRPELTLRLHSFHLQSCDLSFLARMHDVRRFHIESTIHATGIAYVTQIRRLESLAVEISSLESFDFLEDIDARYLKELSLGPTKSKKQSLLHAGHLIGIERLRIDGQQRAIETIARFKDLKRITLRQVSAPSYAFLTDLRKLTRIDVKLGRTNLADVARVPNLRHLGLWWVRKLVDLEPISEMETLERLVMYGMSSIHKFPDMTRLTNLRHVWLGSLTHLTDVSALEKAPNLEELDNLGAGRLEPSAYDGLFEKQRIKRICATFNSLKKNQSFDRRKAHTGIDYGGVPSYEFEGSW